MAKTKFLNSLSYSLAHSYFSTMNYYSVGYMCDWIVNGANDLGIDSIRIDILKKEILPKELMIPPLLAHLDFSKQIIEKTLTSNNLPIDFIKEAIFDIKVTDNRRIICSSYTVGDNGRTYKSKDYIEESYERFIAINQPLSHKINICLKNTFGRFRLFLWRRFNIGRLRYERKSDS